VSASLRKDLTNTLNDSRFLANAIFDLNSLSGAEVAQTIENIFKIEPAIVTKFCVLGLSAEISVEWRLPKRWRPQRAKALN
jgi:hypothetical protein